ncbi:MAG: alpha-galactosidase [Lentisphaeria bacterium]|nr:alpha-galactosidase [Lentisphaeria bacterium]
MKEKSNTQYPLLTEFSFNEKNGIFSLYTADFALYDAAIEIRCGNNRTFVLKNWKLICRENENEENILLEYETIHSSGKYFLSFSVTENEVDISLSVKLKKAFKNLEISYFRDAKTILPDHILARAMNLPGGKTKSIPLSGVKKVENFSAFDLILTREKDKQFHLSYPMNPEHFPRLEGTVKKQGGKHFLTLSAFTSLHNFSGKNITLPPLSLHVCSIKENPSFPEFSCKDPLAEKDIPSTKCAWNSWDYYRWTVTEEEVMKNADFIASDPVLSKHVKRIIIDDGWQYAYGEWVHNGLFPSGMEKIASSLTKMGFEPGLWIAPGIVECVAKIAQTKYDMLAKAEDGVPAMMFNCMERRGFILDPTNEDAHKFWYSLFERYAAMGYKYFKLDFLASMTQIPLAKDMTIPRGKYIPMLFDTVNKAVNGRAELMACGYPYLSGNPGAEAVRVGHDIHAKWDCIKANAADIVSLYPFNGKRWLNDPDFALCRGVETSDDPELNSLRPCLVYNKKEGGNIAAHQEYCLATSTENELEVLLSLVLVSAGIRTLSDNLPLLNASGLRLARKTVSAVQGLAAVPLDLFTSALPSYYLQRLPGRGFRILFINWTEEEKEFSLDLSHYGLPDIKGKDFWKEIPVKIPKGILQKILPPRSCFLAEFVF